ncbi:MAG TPA: gamma-glutamyl-gamma-aminobutyrate hydrolase family protein [Dissulfurispiraceae bacterium]|nr:gamma-glutamyl-gamma-aminobutyrate hydrolase family protein [Dissulfurispiraceae bacterium]
MKPLIGITAGHEGGSLCLRYDYVSAIENSGGIPVALPVFKGPADLCGNIDGLLFTGGADIMADYYGRRPFVPEEYIKPEKRERIEFEIGLMRESILKKVPILAVCFGMQLLNVYHGGTLFEDINYQLANAGDHRRGLHEINIVDLPGGTALKKRYTVNSSHHQAVMDVGEALSVFASADDGIVEGIFKRDYNFCVGVQWHPERIFYDPLSVWLFDALIDAASGTRRDRGRQTIGPAG